MALMPFAGQFTKASGSQQIPAGGLTVTFTLVQVALSGGAMTTLVNAGSATEVTTNTPGTYFYVYSGTLDFTNYFYVGAFKTTDATVQATQVPAAFFDFPLSLAKDANGRVDVGKVGGTAQAARDLGANLDVAVSTRSTFAGGAVASVTAPVALTAAYDPAKTAAQAGDAMGLLTGTGDALVAAAAAAVTNDHGAGSYVRNTEPDNVSVLAVKVATDRLLTMIELDGSVYRYTVNALEQAPAGGGGGTADWTDPERQQIRQALGVAGAVLPTTGAGNLDAVLARTGRLLGPVVTVFSPVLAGGTVALVRGDDYLAADNRAPTWSATGWPDLTGASAQLLAYPGIGGPVPAVLTAAGTVTAAGAGTQTVTVPLAAAQTGGLAARPHQYRLVGTLADGHVVTLATGTLLVSGE